MFRVFLACVFFSSILAACPSPAFEWSTTTGSKCFTFFNTPTSFAKAEIACNQNSGHLASIHDGFTNSFLSDLAKAEFISGTDFWIGASSTSAEGIWRWTDNTPVDFTEWKSPPLVNQCAALSFDKANLGFWNGVECSLQKPYVCENDDTPVSTVLPPSTTTVNVEVTTIPSNATCDSNSWSYFEQTNSCYYWGDNADWSTAEAACVKLGAHLVAIHGIDEINFIHTLYNGEAWIGLYTNSSPIDWDSIWKYTDNSNVDYLNWYQTIPSHTGDQCVKLSGGLLYNINCATVLSNYCKKPSRMPVSTTPALATTTTPRPAQCPTGWSYNGATNLCYGVTPVAVNWTEAESYCQSLDSKNGHLASFHNADDLAFLNTLGQSNWIGLYSDNRAITWKYTDGSPFDYKRWGEGYPERDGSRCANVFRQMLNNYNDCSISTRGICQQPVYTS
jgi:C-type mannose receptor